jgi:anthranilate phosphoribosyltransferase
MKNILQNLFEYNTLSQQQATELMMQIGAGAFNDAEIAAFICAYKMRNPSINELLGFKQALLQMALPVAIDADCIDIVGTGGDGKNTFNISTLACFIVAGAGYKVAKHGNYASTSVTGSSDVLQQLGYTFKTSAADINKELDDANVSFLHAPLFHPALKVVAPVRKQLKMRTVFNMLGPLVNPAQPKYKLLGVFNTETARVYNYVLQQQQTTFNIVHSLDGYDEISLTSDCKIYSNQGEHTATAFELGNRTVSPADITGGESSADAAKIFTTILQGQGSWAQNAVVIANAAKAIETISAKPYADCFALATESLESGKAFSACKKLMGT